MNVEDKLVGKLTEFRRQFRYRYVGGGYFRDKTVPKGETADMQHGDEIISKFCEDFLRYLSETSSDSQGS